MGAIHVVSRRNYYGRIKRGGNMKKVLLLTFFWAMQLTWGFIENFFGALIFLAMVCTGHKPKKFHQMIYFEAGKNLGWGGFNMGFVAIVNKFSSERLLRHEHGHFIQNFFFGPLNLPLQLASAIRYWYRQYLRKYKYSKWLELPEYDAWWYEGMATSLGNEYFLNQPLAKLRGKE